VFDGAPHDRHGRLGTCPARERCCGLVHEHPESVMRLHARIASGRDERGLLPVDEVVGDLPDLEPLERAGQMLACEPERRRVHHHPDVGDRSSERGVVQQVDDPCGRTSHTVGRGDDVEDRRAAARVTTRDRDACTGPGERDRGRTCCATGADEEHPRAVQVTDVLGERRGEPDRVGVVPLERSPRTPT
jgi:hypothetical protein